VWVLGIAGSHNAAAALTKDGKVVVAVQAERIFRRKRYAFPLNEMGTDAAHLIKYCLDYAGIDLPDLKAIATNTPWGCVNPRFVFRENSPSTAGALPPFITVPHHLAHAEYVLHYCSTHPCLVLVCDGSGTYERDRPQLDLQEEKAGDCVTYMRDAAKESISAYTFDGSRLRLIYRIAYGEAFSPDRATDHPTSIWLASVGQMWRWAAAYCHGDSNEAGKVMGLAPYGDPATHRALNTLRIDAQGEVRIDIARLCRVFQTPNTCRADVSGVKHYEDIAAHVQNVTNTFLVDLVSFLLRRFPTENVCYTGGVTLNGIANEHLQRHLGVRLHMNGSCEDNGTAIGAALAVHYALTGERVQEEVTDYYGREYSVQDIERAVGEFSGDVRRLAIPELLDTVARQLASGKVVGWFQGRSEFGPRALGNRSILADARDPAMQGLLNTHIKFREAFRPYAPAVIEERAAEFFHLTGPAPLMLTVVPVRGNNLTAVRHVDGTARVQTVNRRQNATFHDLLWTFGQLTGVPVLLNTSFNRAGEPIVESPDDAVCVFSDSAIDALAIGNFLLQRRTHRG
jgi:carbamoyltransferase